jgi:hypothetical protein
LGDKSATGVVRRISRDSLDDSRTRGNIRVFSGFLQDKIKVWTAGDFISSSKEPSTITLVKPDRMAFWQIAGLAPWS